MSATTIDTTTRIGKCDPNVFRPDDASYGWEDGYRLARPICTLNMLTADAIAYTAAYRDGAHDRIEDLLRDAE